VYILNPDLADTGRVLSSDGQTRYPVHGSCDCQAGQHGQDGKHQHAWKLYPYIAHKLEAQTVPPTVEPEPLPALGEAPASANVRVTIAGREMPVTLRDHDETRLLERLQTVLERFPAPAQPATQSEGWCAMHGPPMRQTTKNGCPWFSHRTTDGQWCKGHRRSRS
jgi:hypothetical protein